MPNDLEQRLNDFAKENKFESKGALCVALVTTRHARDLCLPLNSNDLLAESGGQVLGLGRKSVQAILSDYQIEGVLAAEGGRTSRGSIRNMQKYVELLNKLHIDGAADLEAIERFWINRALLFFRGKPFSINIDASKNIKSIITDILAQAAERQSAGTGTNFVGAVMQHLVGAKLECLFENSGIEHHSFSTSDAQTGRPGDFFIGDCAIHVTTAPGEAVIQRCEDNLGHGYRAILITTARRVSAAIGIAENANLHERIDVFDVEQVITANLYELGGFEGAGRRTAIGDLIDRYNEIIESHETDVSMKISFHNR